MPFKNIFAHRPKPPVTVQPQQPVVPPGDLPKTLSPGLKVQPEDIRDLRELIRKRYALDVEIWNLRHVKPHDRRIVEDKMFRADAMLQKIWRTICAWDSPDAFESLADYGKLQEIKARIGQHGKRFWMGNPPWNDATLVNGTA